MDTTTDTEPPKASTVGVVDSDAVVTGPTGPRPEQASFKLDTTAAADHVSIPTPALHDEASVPQGVGGEGVQGSPTSCTEKSTGATETDPGTLHGGASAEGKLLGLEDAQSFLPSFSSGSRKGFAVCIRTGLDVLLADRCPSVNDTDWRLTLSSRFRAPLRAVTTRFSLVGVPRSRCACIS